ncbi:PspC domain-containing protein [Legionella nautarum]|nr:PspC domain-containing protein [Legionella nautarum]
MTNINILEHVYTCTNEAALKLENYLTKIQKKFQHEPEIIRDIELGLIEQLDLILSGRIEKQVTLVDVEFLIQKMGDVELIDNPNAIPAEPMLGNQNLYRDYDNRIIAGVCAGIAAYFNLSAWLVRFIFILCFFTPIPVVISYLLLWYLIPPALTKSEKLNMKGIPVSINAIVNNGQYARNKIIHLAKLIAIIAAALVFTIASIVFIWVFFSF